MPADALPSLFRWEPGMMATYCMCGGGRSDSLLVLKVCHNGQPILDICGGLVSEPDDDPRPDMSHAGTRGIVLEQVRAALGKEHACSHPSSLALMR